MHRTRYGWLGYSLAIYVKLTCSHVGKTMVLET